LANAVLQHKNAFLSQEVNKIISAAGSLRLSNIEPDDPLRHITKELDLPNLDELMWLGIHPTEFEEAVALGEENLDELKEAARNRIKFWRSTALRGAAGVRFSAEVRQAYNHTCLFTGMRLPKTPETGSSGVDAAHILPWAEYDLNSISNALCLSKLCHWAFDAGILKLSFNSSTSRYEIELSPPAIIAESDGILKLDGLRDIQGVISTSLLPKDCANWPRPLFLKVYNEAMNF
jgi:hypothetical protein